MISGPLKRARNRGLHCDPRLKPTTEAGGYGSYTGFRRFGAAMSKLTDGGAAVRMEKSSMSHNGRPLCPDRTLSLSQRDTTLSQRDILRVPAGHSPCLN